MATKIPAKQLQTVGETPEELNSRLLDRETGWCSGDHTFYYKDGDTLRPLCNIVVLEGTYNTATPTDVSGLPSAQSVLNAVNAGRMVVLHLTTPPGPGPTYHYFYWLVSNETYVLHFSDLNHVTWGERYLDLRTSDNAWLVNTYDSSKLAVFTGTYNPGADPADYSGLPDQADVLAAIDAGKDVVLMLKPASTAPYFPWRLAQAFEYGNVFVKYEVPGVNAEGLTDYWVLNLIYAGPGNPWTWSGSNPKLGKVATFTYRDSYRPALSAMQEARDADKAVIMVLGEDVQVGGTPYAPRSYTLEKGTVMTLVFDTGRYGYGDHSFEFNCFGHFGSSGETGNASGLVMVEAIVKDGSGGDEWEWYIRFDESLGGLGNWNDSIIKQFTRYRGNMVQLILNDRSLGLLPSTAASPLETVGLVPVNQRAQAICWGTYDSEIGYVNMPKFQSVNGPFNINGGTSFMDLDFVEIDNLSKSVALYLNNIKSDDEGPGGTPIHESRCIFMPYAFAQPWQRNMLYTANSSVVWVDGLAYLCNTTHTSGGTWDATEQANWTAKNWLQYVQDQIGNVASLLAAL